MPIFRAGTLIYEKLALPAIQQYTRQQINQLHESSRRFLNPHVYPVGLSENLYQQKIELIMKLRKGDKR